MELVITAGEVRRGKVSSSWKRAVMVLVVAVLRSLMGWFGMG